MNFGPDPKKKKAKFLEKVKGRTFAKYCTDFFRVKYFPILREMSW